MDPTLLAEEAQPRTRPALSLPRVLDLRDQLYRDLLAPLRGSPITPEVWESLRKGLRQLLPGTVSSYAVRASLEPLLGATLDTQQAWRWAWMLAGNRTRLLQGRPARFWSCQEESEWVPVQIEDLLYLSDCGYKKRQAGLRLSVRVLAGSSCPESIAVIWPVDFARALYRDLGFHAHHASDRDEFLGLFALEQYFGLFFAARIDPELSLTVPSFWAVSCPASLVRQNRAILRQRLRLDGFACPFDYEHACQDCPQGITHCPVATHRRSYVYEVCSRCQQPSWHDPGRQPPAGEGRLCLSCQAAEESLQLGLRQRSEPAKLPSNP